ncbi:prepilin peptidase [Desulfurispira natronophila]|uniref:Leader peptidase (Prepilin peptidase)/N-methyltransferase n=1 Tax=Desulfurispira natronophila TaxID=682562 RepID=A0A7W7Y5H4_9BACT|nr:A24 family peptidase [Desulfurispira natronophila]MBB5022468.1 leader peptidase (prepilin peptidase)/N-methyltransferase [Desulfurispira natronophila]
MSLLCVIAFTLVLGACLGSFIAASAHRIPRGVSIVFPASHCPHCLQPIRWRHNIPIFGYLICRGQCFHCQQAISSTYVYIEAGVALVITATVLRYYPATTDMIWYGTFTFFLLGCGIVDLRSAWEEGEGEGIIPDIFSLGGLGVAIALATFTGQWLESAIGALLGGGILMLIFLFYYYVRHIEALGLGDVKMMAMVGAFSGVLGVLYTLFIGSLLGLVAALILMVRRRQYTLQMKLPFGPFLALGALVYIWI